MIHRYKAAGIRFSTHPGVLVKPETYNLSICFSPSEFRLYKAALDNFR